MLAQDLYKSDASQHLGTFPPRVPWCCHSIQVVLDTHVDLEAVVALHRELCHICAGTEVDLSIKVISLQAQPPTRTSVLSQLRKRPPLPSSHSSLEARLSSLGTRLSSLGTQHSTVSSNPRAASSMDGEHPRYPATGPALRPTSHH